MSTGTVCLKCRAYIGNYGICAVRRQYWIKNLSNDAEACGKLSEEYREKAPRQSDYWRGKADGYLAAIEVIKADSDKRR